MPEIEYVWDELSDNVIEEYEDGVLSASYSHEPGLYGNLLSQNRSGVTSHDHYDGRGDTVSLTDDSGNITDTKEYDAWGNVIASTGSTVTPYQFVGRQGYQTGNTGVYVRARMYQPTIARWFSVDPLEFLDGVNRFIPHLIIQSNDPSGLITVQQTGSVNLSERPCSVRSDAYWLFSPTSANGWPCDGLLIQRVEVKCQSTRCASKKEVRDNKQPKPGNTNTFKYYETWQVTKGQSGTVPEGQVEQTGNAFTDHAYYTPALESWGFYRQSSSIALFCKRRNKLDNTINDPHLTDDQLRRLERHMSVAVGKGSKCATGSGSLKGFPFSGDGPTWWTNNNRQEGVAHRAFGVTWDCCQDCNTQDAGASQSDSIEIDIE